MNLVKRLIKDCNGDNNKIICLGFMVTAIIMHFIFVGSALYILAVKSTPFLMKVNDFSFPLSLVLSLVVMLQLSLMDNPKEWLLKTKWKAS